MTAAPGTEAVRQVPAAAKDLSAKEAPALATLVKEGKLPALDKRLPSNPLVMKPLAELGRYGGTLRRAWTGPSDSSNVKKMTSQRLVRFTPSMDKIVPNLAERTEAGEGGRVFTVFLRKGIKWSDGDQFDADDFVFWYEDILLNKDLNPRAPAWLVVADQTVKVEKVDTFTVRFRFADPYGLFMSHLAASEGYDIIFPSHFLKQFHPKYADKAALDKMIGDAGFNQWTQLMKDKTGNNRYLTPGIPTLNPWIAKTDPTSSRFVMERNPYYWKVDTEGRQLPYIDEVAFDLIQDRQVINLKASAGELDFQFRHLDSNNFTLFKENEEKGGYRTLAYIRDTEQANIITINLTTKDPGLRQVVSDPRFRKALSHAVNRMEINELVYGGLAGEPSQVQPFPTSPFHLKGFSPMYTEYSTAKANALLDEMGLTKKDASGFRLRLDGKPLALNIEVADLESHPDVAELTKEYWEKVGVKTTAKVIERSLWQQRYESNDMDVSIWTGTAGVFPLTWPRYYVPTGGQVLWGRAWQQWYESGGKTGEEPPDYMKRAIALYDEIKVTPDEDKQAELFRSIIEIKKEYLWDIGTLSPPPPIVGVASKKLRNYPEREVYSDISRSPGSFLPEQFFFVE